MVRKSFVKQIQQQELTLIDKIDDLIGYNEFSLLLKHIYRFLKRLPDFIKFAWTQEEWDYEYMYDLLEYKMKQLYKALEEDTWHDSYSVNRAKLQIKVCLARLDRYRNWPNHYFYPMQDIKHVKIEDPIYGTCYKPEYTNDVNEQQRLGAIDFEQKNYDKFWKDFLAWHRNWWT